MRFHARVAEVALGRVVADKAVAAVNLDVLGENEVQRIACRATFAHRRCDRVFLERGGARRNRRSDL